MGVLPARPSAAANAGDSNRGGRRLGLSLPTSRGVAALAVAAVVARSGASACATRAATGGTATGSPVSGLYEVNGHHLFLTCAGAGAPMVVLESGLGADHTQWDPVSQLAAAAGVRVCAYDRYGVGQSDTPPGMQTRTLDQVVDDVHALLGAAHLGGPYVLAGTSMGGLIDREFARRFPSEVVGMVLLDSAPDDWDVYTGTETFAFLTESIDVEAASAALRNSDQLGSRPLIVVQAGDDASVQAAWAEGKTDFQAYWASRQRALAQISSDSILALAPGVSHDTIAQEPPGLSSAAIRLVVDAARDGTSLPACAQTSLPGLGALCLSETG